MRIKTLEQKSADSLAGLQIDLLQRLRNGNMSFEQIEWFKNLRFEQREKLMGKIVITKNPKIEIADTDIVIPRLIGGFYPQEHFTENKDVEYLKDGNFKKYVLGPVKTISSLPEINFSKYQFVETVTNEEIREHLQISESTGLMEREEILWTIFNLTTGQLKDKPDFLFDNGHSTIIGYMLCGDGVVRSVVVRWSVMWLAWHCDCVNCDCLGAGSGILFRNLEK